MINSAPNNSRYNQGNFIPKNKDKIIKLNNKGGLYYRSSLELKMMTYLDNNSSVTKWGAECISIPYQMTHFENGDMKIKKHTYYSDFYYELRDKDGVLRQTVVEVKPLKEYKMVSDLINGRLTVPQSGMKKMKNFEYDFKMAQKNREKWDTMIKWCNMKGYNFIVVTEQTFKGFGI